MTKDSGDDDIGKNGYEGWVDVDGDSESCGMNNVRRGKSGKIKESNYRTCKYF